MRGSEVGSRGRCRPDVPRSGLRGNPARIHFAGLAAVIAVLFLMIGCRLGVTHGSTGYEERGVERRWTLLVYMNADNELEPQAIESLNELESVDLTRTGITVLVLLDRTAGYDTSNGDWTATRLFEVRFDAGGPNAVIVSKPLDSTELGLTAEGNEELDMGDPATLRAFLSFAAAHYPAEHTGLFVWGHGSGWRAAGGEASPETRAVSFDDTSSSDPLYTVELSEALADSGLDIVGFDCCSEAMIEVAYQIRSCASYMVASEDVTPAAGWSYRELLDRVVASDRSPQGVLRAIIAAFTVVQADTAGATISAVDLSVVDDVASALDALSESLWSWVHDTASQTQLRSLLFQNVEDFYRIPGDLDLDLVDLAQVVEESIPEVEEVHGLVEAVETAVLFEWHHPQGNPRAHGLAVHYVPLSADGTAGIHADAYFANRPTDNPLAFVADSAWVPRYPAGPGLLYRLWYEVF